MFDRDGDSHIGNEINIRNKHVLSQFRGRMKDDDGSKEENRLIIIFSGVWGLFCFGFCWGLVVLY